jgi:hypothetical protein
MRFFVKKALSFDPCCSVFERLPQLGQVGWDFVLMALTAT